MMWKLFLFAISLFLMPAFSANAKEFTFFIRDETGRQPLSAWCAVSNMAGEYFRPVDQMDPEADYPDHFYAWDRFTLDLHPDVEYRLQVEKGIGWRPFEKVIQLSRQDAQATIRLQQWIHLEQRRWLCGDMEARIFGMDPALPMDALGVNLMCRVVDAASAQTQLEINTKGFHHLPGENAYTGRDWGFGDFNVLGTLLDLVVENETPFEHTSLYYLEKGRSIGGLIDAVRPESPDLPIAAARGWVDTVRTVGPDRPDAPPIERERVMERFEKYYDLLNAGFRFSVSAGSLANEETPAHLDRIGWSRVYARLVPRFSLGNFLKAIEGGSSWATNGPVLALSVNKKDPSETFQLLSPNRSVAISMGARSIRPIDRLELIFNGDVIESLVGSATSDHVIKDFDFSVPEPGWLAARVFEKQESPEEPLRYAHSSPFYFEIRDMENFRRESVDNLAERVETRKGEVKGHPTMSDEERAWLLKRCDEALAYYAGLVQSEDE